jgi:hypothetical protein
MWLFFLRFCFPPSTFLLGFLLLRFWTFRNKGSPKQFLRRIPKKKSQKIFGIRQKKQLQLLATSSRRVFFTAPLAKTLKEAPRGSSWGSPSDAAHLPPLR